MKNKITPKTQLTCIKRQIGILNMVKRVSAATGLFQDVQMNNLFLGKNKKGGTIFFCECPIDSGAKLPSGL
jgi:hypothetical protein